MPAWVVPAVLFTLVNGLLGVVLKIAFRWVTWQQVMLCTGLVHIAVSAALLIRGVRVFDGATVGWAFLPAAIAVMGLPCLFIALERGEATKVIPVTSAYPLVALLLGALLLSEKVSLVHVGGALLIIAGVAVLAVA